MKFVSIGLLSLVASATAFTTNTASSTIQRGQHLFHAPKNAAKHDVQGADPFDSLSPEQKERVQAFMEHQNNVPKPGFPVDVRSLVQYNHGFAVMSTISKA